MLMRLVTAEEMASIDNRTITEIGLPGCVLMERAGVAVFKAISEYFGGMADKLCLIVCGPGNNGGDGFVVARYLREAGARVSCLSMVSKEKLKGDAALYANVYENLYGGGSITVYEDLEQFKILLNRSDLVIEALFGSGLSRELSGCYADVVKELNSSGVPVVAVDVPAGVEVNSGQILGVAPRCQFTVTIGLPKWGLYLEPGRSYAGQVKVADIGFPNSLTLNDWAVACDNKLEEPVDFLVDKEMARQLIPERPRQAHKGTFGTVWVVGGSPEYKGAPVLAAQAVLRSGAGLVVLAAPQKLCEELGGNYLEIMRCPLDDGWAYLHPDQLSKFRWLPDRCADNSALARSSEPLSCAAASSADSRNLRLSAETGHNSLPDSPWPKPKALCLGPGLGRHRESTAFVAEILARSTCPVVIDADALWHVAELGTLGEAASPSNRVVTPHLGELSRLMGVSVEELLSDIPCYARLCAQRYCCTAVIKGNPTVISDGRRCWLNSGGGPVLSQGGTGDVLAGLIAGLTAQGLEPFKAAVLGVYLHSAAGDKISGTCASRGVTASEICNLIPQVYEDLEFSKLVYLRQLTI